MKIGLVRHFKVNLTEKKSLNSNDYSSWGLDYDEADVTPNNVITDHTQWDICYASDLKRAIITAQHIYGEDIHTTPLLREVRNDPFIQTNHMLPHGLWRVVGRIAWYQNHKSQTETRRQTLERIHAFLKQLEGKPHKNVLIVSHGFFMHVLIKELMRKGFSGPKVGLPQNGVLYVYEKQE